MRFWMGVSTLGPMREIVGKWRHSSRQPRIAGLLIWDSVACHIHGIIGRAVIGV